MGTRTLFVGIGSPHGDDRLGWLVADELNACWKTASGHERSSTSSAIAELDVTIRKADNPVDLLDWMKDVDRLVVCDACRGAGPPGTSSRWIWPEPPIVKTHSGSTHQLSLAEVLDLACNLKLLPREVVVWGVQVEAVEPAAGVSQSLATAFPGIVERIRGDLTGA